MTVREGMSGGKRTYLAGWKLVVALVVVAIVTLVALWRAGSPQVVLMVVAPLLVIIGVDRRAAATDCFPSRLGSGALVVLSSRLAAWRGAT